MDIWIFEDELSATNCWQQVLQQAQSVIAMVGLGWHQCMCRKFSAKQQHHILRLFRYYAKVTYLGILLRFGNKNSRGHAKTFYAQYTSKCSVRYDAKWPNLSNYSLSRAYTECDPQMNCLVDYQTEMNITDDVKEKYALVSLFKIVWFLLLKMVKIHLSRRR